MELKSTRCVGCSREILDRFVLRVAPDLKWHAACLKCEECQQYLDENCTCFVRNGKIYCKQDYFHLFGTKCDKCGCTVSKGDLVIRAKTKVFHVDCFRCTPCERQLNPGEEFALEDSGSIYCKDHDHIETIKKEEKSDTELNNNQNTPFQSPDGLKMCNIVKQHLSSEFGSNTGRKNSISRVNVEIEINYCSDSDSESDSCKTRREKPPFKINGKPTRVRTVLNEKQLSVLTACYKANSRPDALLREQLVEMTGLSPRVIRVWFQNKRCKDKKKSQEFKLQMQHEKVSYMQGGMLNELSPVKYESPTKHEGHDVAEFYPSWKAFSECEVQSNYDQSSQHPLNQVCAM